VSYKQPEQSIGKRASQKSSSWKVDTAFHFCRSESIGRPTVIFDLSVSNFKTWTSHRLIINSDKASYRTASVAAAAACSPAAAVNAPRCMSAGD